MQQVKVLRHHRRTVAILGAAVLAVALIPSLASATHSEVSLGGSNFEIDTDANLKVNDVTTPPTSFDWNTVAQQGRADEATGQRDNSFGQGSKEDTAVPAVVDGSIPNNKSDLLNFGFYLENNSSGEFLHLFWHRVQEPSGTTNMDFEFNKNKAIGTGLSSNGVTAVRSSGDLLIQYDLSQGGVNPTLWLSRWVTTGSASECEAANSLPCWNAKVNITTGGIATGSINSSTIPDAESEIPFIPETTTPLDPGGDISPRTFGEATVDWDQVAGGSGTCASFGSAYLKSRSSDTFSSALKDFIAPVATGFDRCGSLRWLKHDDASQLLGGATFSVCRTHSYNLTTTSYTDITDVCVSVVDGSAPDIDATAGEFQLDSQPLGRYTITETAAPTGYDPITSVQTVNITSASATPFSASVPFVNNPKVKIIVLTCNTVTEKLVDSTVGIDLNSDSDVADTGETQATLTASSSSTLHSLCGTGGAVYDDLSQGTYNAGIEVPDKAPLFPVVVP